MAADVPRVRVQYRRWWFVRKPGARDHDTVAAVEGPNGAHAHGQEKG